MLQIDESRIRTWGDLRITGPEQTWCDVAPLLSLSELIAAGDYLVHWEAPLTTQLALADFLRSRARHRGIVRLRQAIGRLSDRSESPKESELRVVIEDAGLPGLAVNYKIRTSGGYDYRGDLAFPRRRLIVEYQSAFHETPERFRADMTRISRLEADDYKVMQVNKDDMVNRAELVSRIRRVHDGRPVFE
jgi:very-short-patch-repair endonuclease